MSSLKDKVILLTGASDGIGAETAVYLSQFGPYLTLTGRNLTNLKSVKQQCQEQGLISDKILLVPADITKEEDMDSLVHQTLETFGRLDVLINNAAIIAYHTVLDTSMEEYDRIMRTNIRAPFSLTKLCLPHIIKVKAHIGQSGDMDLIKSNSGDPKFVRKVQTMPKCKFSKLKEYSAEAAYGISKAALDQLTQILAMEMAEHGVRVNSVNPGVIRTDIQKKGGMTEEQYKQYVERQKTTHPLGHIGEPRDVAKSIAFLASDDASFITGQIMFVDGGRHTKPV